LLKLAASVGYDIAAVHFAAVDQRHTRLVLHSPDVLELIKVFEMKRQLSVIVMMMWMMTAVILTNFDRLLCADCRVLAYTCMMNDVVHSTTPSQFG